MIYTSLAVLALSASTAVSPLSKVVHFHPHSAQPDTRITVTLHNNAPMFQDVKVDGHSYTIGAHQGIHIKAPAGTVVYADSTTGKHHRGDVLLEVSSQVENTTLDLK
jgi:hypothetical protein